MLQAVCGRGGGRLPTTGGWEGQRRLWWVVGKEVEEEEEGEGEEEEEGGKEVGGKGVEGEGDNEVGD
jgi:hypothetical protein